jgi:hypothetical protein
MRLITCALIVLSAAVEGAVAPQTVLACSPDPCGSVQLAPGRMKVPANLPGFTVHWGAYEGSAAKLTVTTLAGSSQVPVDQDHRLGSALVAGEAYAVKLSISETQRCPKQELTTELIAEPEAPLPTSLGSPVVVGQGRGPTAVGSTPGACFSFLDSAYVDLEPSLEGSAAPWRHTISDVVAVVDGKDYWVSSEVQPQEEFYPTRGMGVRALTGGDVRVRVFLACEEIETGSATSYVPLSDGTHRVKLRGTVAGLGSLETSETQIVLSCAPPGETQSDGGAGGAEEDTGMPPTGDTASIPEGGALDEHNDPSSVADSDDSTGAHAQSSCNLVHGPARTPLQGTVSAVLLLLLLLARNRRTRQGEAS